MAQDNGYTVLQQPIGVRIIRIFQFIVAVVAVGLAGYAANVFDPYGTDDGLACLGLTIFTGVATWIITAYIRISESYFNKAYNYWAVLGCDIFLFIFWLSSMADSAHFVAETAAEIDYVNNVYGFTDLNTARNCVGAAAGMGAIEMILFGITIAMHGQAVHRHRMGSTSGAQTTGGAFTANEPMAEIPMNQQTSHTAPQTTQGHQSEQHQQSTQTYQPYQPPTGPST